MDQPPKRLWNEELHMLKAMAWFIIIAVISHFFSFLQFAPFTYLVFLGMLSELCYLKKNYQLICYSLVVVPVMYILGNPFWLIQAGGLMVCYIIGRNIMLWMEATEKYHRRLRNDYRNKVQFQEKIEAAKEQRRYEETVRKLEEEKRLNATKPKKQPTIDEKVIPFKR